MRERLIKLIQDADKNFFDDCKDKAMLNIRKMYAKYLADYLLRNGVIVPPCKVGDTAYEIQQAEQLKKAKSEAIKEFAERLKNEMKLEDDCDFDCNSCMYECKEYVPLIDDLVKEMTEARKS